MTDRGEAELAASGGEPRSDAATPPLTAPSSLERLRQGRFWQGLGKRVGRLEGQLLLVLLLLYLVFSIVSPDVFATAQTLENLARQAGVLMAVSIGQMAALVIGGFDISVAANVGFSSTVLALVIDDIGLVPAVIVGIACGGAVGLVNGIVIARLKVNAFVATLAMLTFLIGLSNELSNGASVPIAEFDLRWFGAADWGPIPATTGIAVIVIVIAYLLFNRLRAGLYIYAIGGSRETSRLSGIPVARYEILAYTFCGLMAGVAGVMLSSRISVGQASLGAGLELQSIAAAVIGGASIGGGVGRIFGVVIGVLILTVLTSGLEIVGVSEFARQMVTGVVLVVAVVFNQRRRLGEWALLKRARHRIGRLRPANGEEVPESGNRPRSGGDHQDA